MLRSFLPFCFACALNLVVVPVLAQSTFVVDDDHPSTCIPHVPNSYATIQEAVNSAASLEHTRTILVCPGTYSESVTIPASAPELTLVGSGPKNPANRIADPNTESVVLHIDSLKGLHAFRVLASDTTVANFTIVGDNRVDSSGCDSATNGITGNGIQIGNTSSVVTGVTVSRNLIQDGRRGINLEALAGSTNALTNHLIEKNVIESTCGGGIRIDGVARATIKGNVVSGAETRPGIPMPNGDDNIIQNNVLTDNTDVRAGQAGGISLSAASTGNSLIANRMEGNIGENGIPLDARDLSSGSATAQTANTWHGNICEVALPMDLCENLTGNH